MNPEAVRNQDAAVESAAARELTPEPRGLNGRTLRAYDEAQAAFAAGDLDSAIGADMLVAALIRTAL